MERRCPNCDQLLLGDETECWQCGQRLSRVPQAAEARQEPAPDVKAESQRSRTALEIYAAWTVVVVIAALAVTVLLGRQPRVQAATVPLPEGWTVVSDRERIFTVFLPEAWEQLDAADEDEKRRMERLLSDVAVYRQATEPLTGFVEDEAPVFLARGSTRADSDVPAAFLIVVRSRLLNRLTPAEAMGLAQEGSVPVLDVRRVTNFEKSHVALRVEVPGAGSEEMTCRQQFTTGEQQALLLALCAGPGQLTSDTVDTVLGSAQRLAP